MYLNSLNPFRYFKNSYVNNFQRSYLNHMPLSAEKLDEIQIAENNEESQARWDVLKSKLHSWLKGNTHSLYVIIVRSFFEILGRGEGIQNGDIKSVSENKSCINNTRL